MKEESDPSLSVFQRSILAKRGYAWQGQMDVSGLMTVSKRQVPGVMYQETAEKADELLTSDSH